MVMSSAVVRHRYNIHSFYTIQPFPVVTIALKNQTICAPGSFVIHTLTNLVLLWQEIIVDNFDLFNSLVEL